MKHSVVYIVSLLASLQPLRGQDYPYVQITTENGLPTNHVHGVTEDREGNIWVYTENGIAKYDGYTFRTFSVKDGLPGNDIVFANSGYEGLIWTSVYNNKPAFIWHDRIYTPFSRPAILLNTNGYTKLYCNNLYYTFSDSTWTSHLPTIPNDLLQFAPEAFEYSYSVRRLRKTLAELAAYPEYPLLETDSVHYYKTNMRFQSNDVWLQINRNPLPSQIFWRNPSKRWQKAQIGTVVDPASPDAIKTAIFDDCYIVNTISLHEAFVLDIQSGHIQFIDLHDLGIHPVMHNAITVVGDYFWISTDDGAAAFSKDGRHVETVRQSELCYKQLLNRTLKDSQGNIWIGSLEGGVFFIPYAHTLAQKLPLPKYQTTHFKQLIPWRFDLLLGVSAQGGVYEIKAGSIKELVPPNPKARFRSAIKIRDELWVSNSMNAFRLQYHNGRWLNKNLNLNIGKSTKFYAAGNLTNQTTSTILPSSVLDITAASYEPQNEDIWGIGARHMIFKFNTTRQSLDYVAGISNSQCIFFDTTRQILLLGRWDGIVQWKDLQTRPLLEGHPRLANVTSLYGTPDNLWIGTESNGIFRYHYPTDSLYEVSDFKVVRNIRPGHDGSLLVAGADGIQVIGNNHTILHHFNHLHGLPSENVEDVAPLGSNALLVATTLGLFEIKLDFPSLKPLDSTMLRITSLLANDASIKAANWSSPLPHHQNNIRFNFHLQHIASRGQITYQTRLEPLETQWRQQADRSIQYPGLQPGTYRFHLSATDIYGRTVALAPFSFTIRPAWWQTIWFKVLVGLLSVCILAVLARIRLQKEKRELQKEKALTKRMAELELSALRAQMNPHFVFNALGAIQYYIQTNDADAADNYLTMFATLMRKYLESSREQVIPLEQEVQLLEYYTQLEMMRFEGIFQTSIQISRLLRQHNALLPSMLVQPFVENAINHGLCERRDGQGRLRIYFEGDEDNIKCTIEDNGIGREKSRQRRSKTHRSQAMRIVEEKIETLQLSGTAAVTVDVSDAEPSNAEYPGTKVVLHIKNLDNEEH